MFLVMGREPNGNAKDKISKEKDILLRIRIIPISGKMKSASNNTAYTTPVVLKCEIAGPYLCLLAL